jgi:hypothetical protein
LQSLLIFKNVAQGCVLRRSVLQRSDRGALGLPLQALQSFEIKLETSCRSVGHDRC